MPSPPHSSLFYHSHNIGEEYRSLSSSLCSFLHSPVTSSLLGPNILLNPLFLSADSQNQISSKSFPIGDEK
jgi:hypothetical protein